MERVISLWAPVNGDDYSFQVRDAGFKTEAQAREAIPSAIEVLGDKRARRFFISSETNGVVTFTAPYWDNAPG